jgi:uncharacterized protein YaiE (UPF0345 family)
MNQSQFDHVTVIKKANIFQEGTCLCISHTVQFDDGTRKTLGVITPGPITFATSTPERMELIAGECRVSLPGATESELFRAGQFFFIPGDAQFTVEALESVEYVCHFEG